MKNKIEKKEKNVNSKTNKVLAIVLIAAIAVSMSACGSKEQESDPSTDNQISNVSEMSKSAEENAKTDTEADTEISTEISTEASDGTYKPVPEIVNSNLSSGYVQINDDIFRNGGYITIGEFYEKYKDKYDVTSIDTYRDKYDEFNGYWKFTVECGDTSIKLHTMAAPDKSTDVMDGVIVLFDPKKGCTGYLPGGFNISVSDESTYDVEKNLGTLKNYFESEGMEYFDAREVDSFNYSTMLDGDNSNNYLGKYSYNEYNYGEYFLGGLVQMDEPNLYGYKPILHISGGANGKTGVMFIRYRGVRFEEDDYWEIDF